MVVQSRPDPSRKTQPKLLGLQSRGAVMPGWYGLILWLWLAPNAAVFRSEEATRLANAIRDLRKHSFDCLAQFEVDLETNGKRFNQEWNHWINEDASIFRSRMDFEYTNAYGNHHDCSWEYITDEFRFSAVTVKSNASAEEPKTNYSTQRVPFDNQKRQYLPPVDEAFGFLPLWDVYWDEVLTNKNTRIVVRNENSEATTIVATLAGTGEFEFTFDATSEFMPLSVVTFRAAPDDLKDHKWFSAFQFRMDDIRYRQFEERPLIEGYRLLIEQTSKNPDGTTGRIATIEKKIQLKHFERLRETLGKRISFPGVDLPDGTRVRVLNDPNVPHELRSGMIVRVLPESSVIATKDARFRQPESSSSWWYVSLGVALLALVAVFVYRRWG